MPEQFQNKYRISSARLQNWDYGSNASYFITICTKNREQFFGNMVENEMQLNEIGKLAEKFWLEIPNHFSFVELGNFVVMPNHFHGIIVIDKPIDYKSPVVETLQCNVSTKNEKMANISPKPGSISSIIRSYKSILTKNAHLIHADFEWQTRFHDHIIRNSKSLEKIQKYITNNPSVWDTDKYYQ